MRRITLLAAAITVLALAVAPGASAKSQPKTCATSSKNVVGKTVQLNNRAYQVIGIAPEYFAGTKFALSLDFWTPISNAEDLRRNPGILAERGSHWMNVIGRVKPGVSVKQASAEMNAIAARLNQAYPDTRASNTTAQVLTEVDGRWEDLGGVFKSAGAIATNKSTRRETSSTAASLRTRLRASAPRRNGSTAPASATAVC